VKDNAFRNVLSRNIGPWSVGGGNEEGDVKEIYVDLE
jgi:hypothetical protein